MPRRWFPVLLLLLLSLATPAFAEEAKTEKDDHASPGLMDVDPLAAQVLPQRGAQHVVTAGRRRPAAPSPPGRSGRVWDIFTEMFCNRHAQMA